MAFYDKFPYTNFQELNLDKIMQKVGDVDRSVEESAQHASDAEASALNAEDQVLLARAEVERAAEQANNAHAEVERAAEQANNAHASAQQAAAYADSVQNVRAQINSNTERIDNILVQGTPTEGNAELIDIRVGGNGVTYSTAGDAVRGQFNTLKSMIRGVSDYQTSFVIGGLNQDGEDIPNTNRIRTDFIRVYASRVNIVNADSRYRFNVFRYNADRTTRGSVGIWITDPNYTIEDEGMAYIRIVAKRADDADTTSSDVAAADSAFSVLNNNTEAIIDIYNKLQTEKSALSMPVSSDGKAWYATSAVEPFPLEVNYKVRSFLPFIVHAGDSLVISDTAQAKVYRCTENGTPLYTGDQPWVHDTTVTAAGTEKWYVNIAAYPTSPTADIDTFVSTCKFTYPLERIPDILDEMNEYMTSSESSNCYSIGADLVRRNIKWAFQTYLSRKQAFCIYQNKFYSVEEGHITEQDMNGAVLHDETIAIGHANSIQLGHNGKAYVSGWNDSKLYKVDLSTLTVEETYTLPLTGYTTGVVDDVKNIAYVFQRDSYPDTEAIYNFITIDLTDMHIIERKALPVPFGAMQACDLYEGRIIVMNGLGTTAVPNGHRVYDLYGNIISNIVTPWATSEPEGVAVNRDTGQLFMMVSTNGFCIKFN